MTSIQDPSRIQVTFADFEDLTSRLVLLPRVEDEGRGAVVASYSLSDPADKNTKLKEEGNPNNPLLIRAQAAIPPSAATKKKTD